MKSIAGIALGALILSSLALADFLLDWGLCGSAACDDPRWRTYGVVAGMPVAGLGVVLYGLISALAWRQHRAVPQQQQRRNGTTRDRSAVVSARPSVFPTVLAALCGLALGGHLYFSSVQTRIIHAWCLLCIAIALIAAVLFAMSLWVARERLRGSLALAVGMVVVSFLGGWLAHRGIQVSAAPDPLVRMGGPAIYRPEAVANVPLDPLERMRAARSIGPEDAPVLIEVFTDFECPRCAELENVVWPQLAKGLRTTLSSLRVTYRVFLLEGHPLGWRAAFQCLAAGERKGCFNEAMQALFLRQGEWVGTGNIGAVLERVPALTGQSEGLLNEENTKAAKALIREDVARGARLGVRVVPTVVVSIPGTEERKVLRDLQPVRVYAQAIQDLVRLAQSRPRTPEGIPEAPLPQRGEGEQLPIPQQTASQPAPEEKNAGTVASGTTHPARPSSNDPSGFSVGPRSPEHLYVTWERVGTDRIGTGWLIKRFVDSEARFAFIKANVKPERGLPFDIPLTDLSHHGMHCAFQHALILYGLEADQALQKMGRIINDVLPEDTLLEQQGEMKLKVREFRKAAQNNDAKAFELMFPWLDDLYVSMGGDPVRIGKPPRAIAPGNAKAGEAP